MSFLVTVVSVGGVCKVKKHFVCIAIARVIRICGKWRMAMQDVGHANIIIVYHDLITV